MAKQIDVIEYDGSYKDKWDDFVCKSLNGTFLHTRNFLEYHPADRFEDASLLFAKGTTILAVVPANKKGDIFFSHNGSTFGGLVLSREACRINSLEGIFTSFEKYLNKKGYVEAFLKQTSYVYCGNRTELLDYYYFINGYDVIYDLGYYIRLDEINKDIISSFSSSRRRDYRYSLKNGFEFAELSKKEEIKEFYSIICDNYRKFDKSPVHSLEDLMDFKFHRLTSQVIFYGVFLDKTMVGGSMVFTYEGTFHTQYLAVRLDSQNSFVSEFLYTNLIREAKERNYKMISFGTASLNHGLVINRNLALYKEGFGTDTYINRTYHKIIRG